MIINPWNFVYSVAVKISWDSVWKKDIPSRSKTWVVVNTPGYCSFPKTKQLAHKCMASVARSCRAYMYMNECVFLRYLSEGESNAWLETIFERTKIPASMTTKEADRKVLKQHFSNPKWLFWGGHLAGALFGFLVPWGLSHLLPGAVMLSRPATTSGFALTAFL